MPIHAWHRVLSARLCVPSHVTGGPTFRKPCGDKKKKMKKIHLRKAKRNAFSSPKNEFGASFLIIHMAPAKKQVMSDGAAKPRPIAVTAQGLLFPEATAQLNPTDKTNRFKLAVYPPLPRARREHMALPMKVSALIWRMPPCEKSHNSSWERKRVGTTATLACCTPNPAPPNLGTPKS